MYHRKIPLGSNHINDLSITGKIAGVDDDISEKCNNNNNNKSSYKAPWFRVTLFKGAVTSKKHTKTTKGKCIKKT